MAVRPLRPATDRRLGRPLPCQPANQTRAHPVPCALSARRHAAPRAYAVLAPVSRCYPPVQGRLPTRYSPVRHWHMRLPAGAFRHICPFDLHVLGTPPAFILSQDQTLMFVCPFPGRRQVSLLLLPVYCFLGPAGPPAGSCPLNFSSRNFQGCIAVHLPRFINS